jgi:hypothetical protein
MRNLVAFVFVALVVGCNGPVGDLRPAGKLKIVGETECWPDKLVRLRAEGVPDGAQLRWRVTPDDQVDIATTTRDVLEFVAPAGDYQVELLTLAKDKPDASFDEARVTVSIFGPGRKGKVR